MLTREIQKEHLSSADYPFGLVLQPIYDRECATEKLFELVFASSMT